MADFEGDVDAGQATARKNKDAALTPGKISATENYGQGGSAVSTSVPGKQSGTEHLPAAGEPTPMRASPDAAIGRGRAAGRGAEADHAFMPAASTGLAISRKAVVTAGVAATVAMGPTVIVEDNVASLEPGQITKKEFFEKLEPKLKDSAREVLGMLWSIAGCPYITKYLAIYRVKPAPDVERFIRRYTGSKATDAQVLIADIATRVKDGVRIWKETGALPGDVSAADPVAAKFAADDARTAKADGGAAQAIQRKAQPGAGPAHELPGGAQAPGDKRRPERVLEQLGAGSPLDPTTQARMEKAFGASFGDVRVHTDAEGAAAAAENEAIAFAVGNHVAFAPGKYQPGTVEGDALLAHELTHVLQQRGATGAAQKEVSEVGDAAEHDADHGAKNAVLALHGDEKAKPEDKADAKVSSGLQLQRCVGTLNEGEDQLLQEQRGFWTQDTVLDGDPFHIKVSSKHGANDGPMKNNYWLEAHFDYSGADDTDGHQVVHSVNAVPGKQLAPKIFTDAAKDWSTFTIDVHGDGDTVMTVKHRTTLLSGWNPKSREHNFIGQGPGDKRGFDNTVVVKSKNALPGTTANTPVTGADPDVQALRIDIAATTTKRWLDEILTDKTFNIDASQPQWAGLKTKVDADAAKYQNDVVDAHDEATKLTRLGQVLTRSRSMLKALGVASNKEAYLPDIAEEALAMVNEVRTQYAKGIAASWDGPATAELGEADAAFNALWFRISQLYMQQGKGVHKLITDTSFAAQEVRNMRGGGRPGIVYPTLEAAIGVPGAGAQANDQGPITDANRQWVQIREHFMRGDTGMLGGVEKITTDMQTMSGVAAMLSTIEVFYQLRGELDGVVGTIADKTPGTTNYTQVCNKWIGKLEKSAARIDAELKAGKKLQDVAPAEVAQFAADAKTQAFKDDVDGIQSRIKHVKVIETLGKVLLIIGVAAMTGGAAGAMVGGALEGAGASAAVIATGEFAAEVVTFTIASRIGNEAAFGKNDTSLGEDLITNAMMFGFLKGAMAGYGRVFKAFAKTHKTAFAVGGALTGMVGLQIFAEIHHKLKTGKMMDWDDRMLGIFQNAVMMVALGLGGYLAKGKAERIRTGMLKFAAKNVPGALERIEGKLAGLKAELDALKKSNGAKADMDKLTELLGKIEKLWNEQISVLAEAAKLEKENHAAAVKEFQEQVAMMVKEIAKLDLQLSAAGIEVELGADKGGNFFKPLSPGYVAFKEGGLDVLKDYYKENGGTFAEVKGKDGLYSGKDASGEIFFIRDDATKSFFDVKDTKPPSEADAKANRAAAEKAKISNKVRAAQLRKLLQPHLQEGHCTFKFGRVINGTGLAAALDANTLPGAAHGEAPAAMESLPATIGLGTGLETFAKLGDTPIGQAAPELSGGGGWANGASPGDMTANHGDYTSAQSIASAVALTQLKSGVTILDGAVLEVSLERDATWKVPDAKVRIKTKLADGSEIYIYSDATDIATGLGPPRGLDKGQINADPAKEAQIKQKLDGDGRLVYGDIVGMQRGGDRVLVSGGSATGAWNASLARKLGANIVDWIARDSRDKAPPKSEHNARKYEQLEEQLANNEITPEEAQKKMADLRAFDAAALPRNVQSADAAMNDAGIQRHVKEIKSMVPTEDIGEGPGKVKVTFTDGSEAIYDQVVVSHGTNIAAKGETPGAATLAQGIQLRPIVVDGQVVGLESVNPPGAVRIVGAAVWSRGWLESITDPAARSTFEKALDTQALNSPRDSPANPLIFNTSRQIPNANKAIGGGPVGGVRGGGVYGQNTVLDSTTNATSVKSLTAGEVKGTVEPLEGKKVSGNAGVKAAPGTVTEAGATMQLFVPTDAGEAHVNVTLQIKPAGDLTATTAHGGDAGPARLDLRKGPTGWDATIEISSATKPEDLPFVLKHELNEAAELVRRNPGGPPKEGFGTQVESSLLKPNAAKGATATPHDVAAANEVIELFRDWQKLEAEKSPLAPHRKGVLDRALEANGLNDKAELQAKKDLLKSQGAPQELLDRVDKGQWKAPKRPGTKFNKPVNHGKWLGDPADSGWIDDRADVIRIVGRGADGEANPIVFRQGVADFTPWSQGELDVSGLNGKHENDMKLIRIAVADRQGLAIGQSPGKRAKAGHAWMQQASDGFGGTGLRPHHAGGSKIQLIPKDVHQVQHTDMAVYE